MILTEKSPVSSTPATKSQSHLGTQPLPALPNPPAPLPDTSLRCFPSLLPDIIGLNEAIVLSQMHYWMLNPKAGYYHHGRKWIYNGYKEWLLQFPWLKTPRRVGIVIRSLETQGCLISDNYNHNAYDRRKHYTLNYETIYRKTGWNPLNLPMLDFPTMDSSESNDPLSDSETLLYTDFPQNNPHKTNNSDVAFLDDDRKDESGTSTGTSNREDEWESECRTENEPIVEPTCVEMEVKVEIVADGDSSKPVERDAVDAVVEPLPKPKFEFPKLKKPEKAKPEARSDGEKEEIDRVLDDAGLPSPKLKAFALKYSLDEVQKALAMLRKQGDTIQNTAGWLTNCLKGRWWKSHQRQKAPPAKPWEAEFNVWYAWAISEGIVEDVPVRHLATDYRGEPIVRLAQPDRLTRAPYTPESWRKAMDLFPMPEGAKEKLPGVPSNQDASLADEDDRLRNRPAENDDRLPSGESSNSSPGDVFREVNPDKSPAPPSHIAQNHPIESVTQNGAMENPPDSSSENVFRNLAPDRSPDLPSPSVESVTDNERSGSPPDETSPGNVSRKVALDFNDPDWTTFPWEPKNGWSPGANRERLLRQKAEWCRNQLLRVSSDEEMYALFEKLGDCALSCLEWIERHLLTPQDIASRHARIEARRNYQQQSLLELEEPL